MIGNEIKGQTIKGSAVALAVGIVLTLYAGLGVTGAVRNAFDHIWRVPRHGARQLGPDKGARCRAARDARDDVLVATAVSGLVSGGLTGVLLSVFGIVFSILLNIGLFLVTFKVLCSESISVARTVARAFCWPQCCGRGYS